MLLTVPVKLAPTPEQAAEIEKSVRLCNEAATWIAGEAHRLDLWRLVPLHNAVYYEARKRFPDLSSRCIQLAIKRVVGLRHLKPRRFRPLAAVPFDKNSMAFWKGATLSWNACSGRDRRVRIPVLLGDWQEERVDRSRCAGFLDVKKRTAYLVVEVAEPSPTPASNYLGVDLGIVNLATDSDGRVHVGADVEKRRRIHSHRRRNLSRKNTRAARRKLRQLSGKQARYQRDVNHRISKEVVRHAEGTGRGIALEDLKGIRERVTVTRRQRARHSNWSYAQLRAFIEYKALLAGVPVVVVDPRNTSRTCPECGCIDKANRPTRDKFCCKDCGFAGPADVIAAVNISARAAAMQPMVAA